MKNKIFYIGRNEGLANIGWKVLVRGASVIFINQVIHICRTFGHILSFQTIYILSLYIIY